MSQPSAIVMSGRAVLNVCFGLAVLLRSIPESWYQAPVVSDPTAGTLAWFDSAQFARSCNPSRGGFGSFRFDVEAHGIQSGAALALRPTVSVDSPAIHPVQGRDSPAAPPIVSEMCNGGTVWNTPSVLAWEKVDNNWGRGINLRRGGTRGISNLQIHTFPSQRWLSAPLTS